MRVELGRRWVAKQLDALGRQNLNSVPYIKLTNWLNLLYQTNFQNGIKFSNNQVNLLTVVRHRGIVKS